MDFVRVRDEKAGRIYTIGRAYAEGAMPDQILPDEPGVDRYGRILPPTNLDGRPLKPRVTIEEAAARRPRRNTAAATQSTSSGPADQSGDAASTVSQEEIQ